jgi:tetratricopeptide (TPR) repeat protein
MRKLLLAVWLTLPLAGFVYHLSAGESHAKMDLLGSHLQAGRNLARQSQWTRASQQFQKALELVPENDDQLRQTLRLELAQSRIYGAGLSEANEDLKKLLGEITAPDAPAADSKFVSQVREALASSQYYLTWLMRLEGLPETDWKPEIESARQNYRLLAEQARETFVSAEEHRQHENLEAAIRLEQMALSDLQGLPIPKPCQNCCSNCRNRRPSSKTGQKPKDARGTSAGKPADGEGS